MSIIRPAGEVQLKNATLEVMILPAGSRATTVRTVTGPDTEVEIGSETIELTIDTDDDIEAGTSLSFKASGGTTRSHVLITEDVSLTTTATEAKCEPLIAAVEADATADFISGLVPLFGLQNYSFQTSPQEVDTTNSQSGYGQESALVRSDKTIDIDGIQVPGDKALYDVIKAVAMEGGNFGREVYAVFTYPDGEILRGAAKIKQYSEPGNQNEVKKYAFQLQFQGASFERVAPVTFS